MTINIHVKTNEKELKKKLGLFKRKYLPDATAEAYQQCRCKGS